MRIYHEDLNPSDLTFRPGVAPSKSQIKGQPFEKRPAHKAPTGGWFLQTKGRVMSKDASEHVEWLLDHVAHCSGVIRNLQSTGYSVDVCVFIQSDTFNTAPTLQSHVMRRLGAMNLDCWFDMYFYGD